MKFRFCGERDCPDWLLAEIVVLTKLTSVKMKLLVGNVIKDIIGTSDLDYSKVTKLTADAKLGAPEIKVALAIIAFLLTNAAKNNCDGETLSNEVQQLGLPKENGTAMAKAYNDNADKIRAVLKQQSLRLWKLDDLDWRVDYTLSSSSLEQVNEPAVQLKMTVGSPHGGDPSVTKTAISASKFQLLLHELKQANAIMEGYEQ